MTIATSVKGMLDEDQISLARVYFEAGDHEHLIELDGRYFHELMRGVRHGHIVFLVQSQR